MHTLSVCVLAGLLTICGLKAQPLPGEPRYDSHLELMLFRGFILMHDQKIGHLIKSHPQGFKLNYVKNTNGKKYWEAHYGYPDLGISVSYQNYRNPQLGHSLSLIPYISFYPLRGEKSSLKWNMGTGLAYHTNPHHQQDNNLNIALGSALSSALYVGFQYQLKITPSLTGGLFFHVDHYSNGGFKKPNSGINLVQGGVSLSHKLQKSTADRQRWEKQLLTDKRLYVSVLPNISFKELGRGGGRAHPSYNFSINLNKPVTRTSIINIGLDGAYDIAMKRWIAEEDLEEDQDFKSAALTLGHELMVDRFSFLTQLGYHVYRPKTTLHFQDFFQRYGLRVYFNPKFAVSGSLKTYFGKAEQIEWGLLFRL